FLCAMTLFLSAAVQAQKITGSLRGDITDPSAAIMSGATVTIRNQATATSRSTITDEHGSYAFEFLTPGTYDVTVEHTGFKRKVLQRITVDANKVVQVTAVMEVGDVQQEVAVQAAAPLLQTAESSVNSTIDFRQVQQLPLNGRQFLQLALLVPGATQSAPG